MVEGLVLTTARKVTVVDSILRQFVSQIREGVLPPGTRLPSERELIDVLGVGRSSVREALQALAAMGLVEVCPGQGTFVVEPKPPLALDVAVDTLSSTLQKDMRDHLNHARLTIELAIVSVAAENMSDVSRASILRKLEEWDACADDGPSGEVYWRIHEELHLEIARASGNPILVQVLQMLLNVVPRTLRAKGFTDDTPEGRARLVAKEAVVRGDLQAAKAWLLNHYESERQVIEECYGCQTRGTLVAASPPPAANAIGHG